MRSEPPADWDATCWGDLVSLKYGKALPAKDREEGSVTVFGTNGPTGSATKSLGRGPTVVIGRKGAYRGVHFSPGPFWVIDTAFYIEPKEDLNLLWAFYALKTEDINRMDSGSAIPSTSRQDFEALPVSYPPRDEQNRVAWILGTLDSKIELNRRIVATLEETLAASFYARFVDFVGTDDLTRSEVGAIPSGWEVGSLGDYVEVVKGRSYKSAELAPSETALVTLKSFNRGGGYATRGAKAFTGEYKPEQVVQPGDVVVAHTDLTQARDIIARPAVVRKTPPYSTLVASLDVAVVRPKVSWLSEDFLYGLFQTKRFNDHAVGYANGSTVLHLNKAAIPEFRFAVPPNNAIEGFQELAEPVHALATTLEDEAVSLETIRDNLLPKLISGEIRVPEGVGPDLDKDGAGAPGEREELAPEEAVQAA